VNNNFYLACFRDNVGSSVSFHGKDFKGYTTNIDNAHVATLDEAQDFYNRAREFDQPISSSQVDALAIWKVDSQLVSVERLTVLDDAMYVAHEAHTRDGNDLCWINVDTGIYSSDYSKASRLSGAEWSKQTGDFTLCLIGTIEPLKRRTFKMSSFDKHTMVLDAGLVVPKQLNSTKPKSPNAKNRFNCPGCGKISWQDNPHDFEGCRDINCVEWYPL